MKKSKIYLFGFLVVAILIIASLYFSSGQSTSGKAGELPSNDLASKDTVQSVQKISLSFKDYNYYPNTITVKAGQPVQISLDSSVSGCFRSFTINQLNLRKYLKSPSDYLEFTPTKKGTYRFACNMGMGTGILVVQ